MLASPFSGWFFDEKGIKNYEKFDEKLKMK
jgi:hypothetical protein